MEYSQNGVDITEVNGNSDYQDWRSDESYDAGDKPVDFPKQSELSDKLLNDLPDDRKHVADIAFKDAPSEIVNDLNNHADDLKPVADSGYGFNEYGERVKNGSYYSPEDSQVRMNEDYDDDEYEEVLPHELSHFLDHQHGWDSRKPEFTEALGKDLSTLDRSTPEGRARFNEMLDDAVNTGAADDRAVSDLLFGAFGENGNDLEIISRFDDEGISKYSHSDNYWMGIDENGIRADDGGASMRNAEIYAEIGAVRCLNSRISNNFIERYFPNTYSQYNRYYNIK